MPGKHIEGTQGRGLTDKSWGASDPVENDPAPAIELGDHRGHTILGASQSGDGSGLGKGAHRQHEVLLELNRSGNQLGGCCQISNSPACHGIGLGKGAPDKGSVFHVRYGGGAEKITPLVQYPIIGLVRENQEPVLIRKAANPLDLFGGQNGACGVMG